MSSFGAWHPEVLGGVALLGAGYVALARRVSPPPSRTARAAFAGALLAILVALNGPLHDLSEASLFSAHMVQHLLLTLVVPPLLLLGASAPMLDTILAVAVRPRAVRRLAHGLTRPVPALALYTVALVLWHLPRPFEAALRDHGLHVLEHLSFLTTATLAWWPVLARSAILPPLHYGAQLLYLFAFGIPMTLVAAMVTAADEVLYPFYAGAPGLFDLTALADQRLGGLLMWVPAGLIPLAAFTAVFFRWAAAEHEE